VTAQQRIAEGNLTACHHLGEDAHIDMVESAFERADNVEVPFCGDLGCRASGDRRDDPQPRGCDRDLRVDPVVLGKAVALSRLALALLIMRSSRA
jgi:hypothetical protein